MVALRYSIVPIRKSLLYPTLCLQEGDSRGAVAEMLRPCVGDVGGERWAEQGRRGGKARLLYTTEEGSEWAESPLSPLPCQGTISQYDAFVQTSSPTSLLRSFTRATLAFKGPLL